MLLGVKEAIRVAKFSDPANNPVQYLGSRVPNVFPSFGLSGHRVGSFHIEQLSDGHIYFRTNFVGSEVSVGGTLYYQQEEPFLNDAVIDPSIATFFQMYTQTDRVVDANEGYYPAGAEYVPGGYDWADINYQGSTSGSFITGRAGTSTATGIPKTADTSNHLYRFEFNPGVNVKCYIDGVLQATNTTNLPIVKIHPFIEINAITTTSIGPVSVWTFGGLLD